MGRLNLLRLMAKGLSGSDGAARDGAVKDGAVKDDVARDGAAKDDAIRDGVVKDGAAADDAVREGVVKDGTVKDGAVRDGAAGDCAAGDCAAGDGAGIEVFQSKGLNELGVVENNEGAGVNSEGAGVTVAAGVTLAAGVVAAGVVAAGAGVVAAGIAAAEASDIFRLDNFSSIFESLVSTFSSNVLRKTIIALSESSLLFERTIGAGFGGVPTSIESSFNTIGFDGKTFFAKLSHFTRSTDSVHASPTLINRIRQMSRITPVLSGSAR